MWRSMCGGRRVPFSPARSSNQIAGRNLTGARWGLTGAEAVLRLRALRSSNDFDAYWKFHEQQEYERNHASHYANHRLPETVPSAIFLSQPSRRSTLKIVKNKGES